MSSPAIRILLPLLCALCGCVPAEYRSADDLGSPSGTAPEFLPLRSLPGVPGQVAAGPAADTAELDARNAALAQRRDALESGAGTADSGALLGRAEDLRSRADALRARE